MAGLCGAEGPGAPDPARLLCRGWSSASCLAVQLGVAQVAQGQWEPTPLPTEGEARFNPLPQSTPCSAHPTPGGQPPPPGAWATLGPSSGPSSSWPISQPRGSLDSRPHWAPSGRPFPEASAPSSDGCCSQVLSPGTALGSLSWASGPDQGAGAEAGEPDLAFSHSVTLAL